MSGFLFPQPRSELVTYQLQIQSLSEYDIKTKCWQIHESWQHLKDITNAGVAPGCGTAVWIMAPSYFQ